MASGAPNGKITTLFRVFTGILFGLLVYQEIRMADLSARVAALEVRAR